MFAQSDGASTTNSFSLHYPQLPLGNSSSIVCVFSPQCDAAFTQFTTVMLPSPFSIGGPSPRSITVLGRKVPRLRSLLMAWSFSASVPPTVSRRLTKVVCTHTVLPSPLQSSSLVNHANFITAVLPKRSLYCDGPDMCFHLVRFSWAQCHAQCASVPQPRYTAPKKHSLCCHPVAFTSCWPPCQ